MCYLNHGDVLIGRPVVQSLPCGPWGMTLSFGGRSADIWGLALDAFESVAFLFPLETQPLGLGRETHFHCLNAVAALSFPLPIFSPLATVSLPDSLSSPWAFHTSFLSVVHCCIVLVWRGRHTWCHLSHRAKFCVHQRPLSLKPCLASGDQSS